MSRSLLAFASALALLAVACPALAAEAPPVTATPAALPVPVPVPVAAPPATPPDLVTLHDGSMLRGTIVELIARDHVDIQLATGVTRHFEMKDVAFAGPASLAPVPSPAPAAPAVAAPPAAAPPSVDITLSANEPGVTFLENTGSSSLPSRLRALHFRPLCTAPCTTTLPEGAHYIGLAHEGDAALLTDGPVDLKGPGKLKGTLTSRHPLRVGGVVIMAGSSAAAAVLVADAFTAPSSCDRTGQVCEFNKPEAFAGAFVVIAGLATGIVFTLMRDSAHVEFIPGTPPPSPGAAARGREGVAFDPRGASARVAF